VRCKLNPHDADRWIRLEDELDAPAGPGHPGQRRTFLASTGRGQAWEGAIDQAEQRPVAGYGFGTEDHVFVDRYYSFFGGSPESSYVGMFLQLGLVGLLLLLALAGALVRGSVTALRRLGPGGRRVAAACTAVLVTGLGLGVVQSSLYAVGNTATVATWTCAFLGLALAPRPASDG
jgi:O-antigen ligase